MPNLLSRSEIYLAQHEYYFRRGADRQALFAANAVQNLAHEAAYKHAMLFGRKFQLAILGLSGTIIGLPIAAGMLMVAIPEYLYELAKMRQYYSTATAWASAIVTLHPRILPTDQRMALTIAIVDAQSDDEGFTSVSSDDDGEQNAELVQIAGVMGRLVQEEPPLPQKQSFEEDPPAYGTADVVLPPPPAYTEEVSLTSASEQMRGDYEVI
jgi:hypothetical protein